MLLVCMLALPFGLLFLVGWGIRRAFLWMEEK